MEHVVKQKKGGLYVDGINIYCGNCNTYITGSAADTTMGTVSAAEQKGQKRSLTQFKAGGPWIEISGGLSF